MFRFREEFSHEISAEGDSCDTVLLVRHDPSQEEKRVVISAQEFIGNDWDTVLGRYLDQLLAELGYVDPPVYGPEEFIIDIWLTDDGDQLVAKHERSGLHSSPFKLGQARAGLSFHSQKDKMMVELTRKLILAGIAPQEPDPLRKKAGKPRWNEARNQDSDAA